MYNQRLVMNAEKKQLENYLQDLMKYGFIKESQEFKNFMDVNNKNF
jgi:hypothetical protein